MAFPLNARVGPTQVQLLIVFTNEQTGQFPAGPLGDNEKSSTPQGVTLDGMGHWGDPAPPDGGTISLAVDDASSASGNADVKLSSGIQTIGVKGTWRCVKPPGF